MSSPWRSASTLVRGVVDPVTGRVSSFTVGSSKAYLPKAFQHPALFPSASAVTPTLATSGPGGSSPISPKTTLPYTTNSINFIGSVPVLVNALGTNYFANNAAGVTGSGATPCAIEFGMYGADFDIIFRNSVASNSFFWVWATDPDTGVMRPQTALPIASTAAASNSLHYYRITFGSSAERVVRVYYSQADFGGLDIPPASSIFPIPKPARSLCIIGDSFSAATGATSLLTGWATTIGRLLGVETFINAVGGTGYMQGSTTNSFLAAPRVAAAIATSATDFLISGSINDSSFTPAQVTTAATSLITQIRQALPNAKIWVSGVQMLPIAYTTGNNVANNTALAALCASLATPFIDEIANSWYSGTGRVGATAGNGNRDLLCWTDSIHPSQAGHDYIAARMYSALMALGW